MARFGLVLYFRTTSYVPRGTPASVSSSQSPTAIGGDATWISFPPLAPDSVKVNQFGPDVARGIFSASKTIGRGVGRGVARGVGIGVGVVSGVGVGVGVRMGGGVAGATGA